MIDFLAYHNFIFLISLLILIILYILKLNRKEQKVPFIYFFKKTTFINKGSALFKKFVINKLFLIEAFFLILIVLALTNPVIKNKYYFNNQVIILIDNSITMSTYEKNNIRLQLAIDKAKEIINQNNNSYFTIIEFASQAKILGYDLNLVEAFKILENIKPNHTIPNYEQAISLAYKLCSDDKIITIHIISDFALLSKINFLYDNLISFHTIGENTKNIGICNLNVTKEYIESKNIESYDIFYSIKNYSNYEVSVLVNTIIDNKKNTSTLTLEPFQNETKILKQVGVKPNFVFLELICNDDLKVDNKRVWQSIEDDNFLALIISNTPDYYKIALESINISNISVSENFLNNYFDLIIIDTFENIKPENLLQFNCKNIVIFNPPNDFLGIKAISEKQCVNSDIFNLPYDYIKNINLFDLYIQKMKNFSLNSNFKDIVYFNQIPIFAKTYLNNKNIYIAFFNPLLSNFPLLPSFPIYFNNIIEIIKNQKTSSDNFIVDKNTYFSKHIFTIENKDIVFTYESNQYYDNLLPIYLKTNNLQVKENVILGPIFTISGYYNIHFLENDNTFSKSIFRFFVNPPVSYNLNIMPKQIEIKNNTLNFKKENKNFVENYISLYKMILVLALILFLLDWLYQNYRMFFKS